jgi:toxin YhaV
MGISWKIYYYIVFEKLLDQLIKEVKLLRSKNPNDYKKHEKTIMLAQIFNVIFKEIAINPNDPRFLQGNTLGKKHRSWRRAKDRMPDRYRLFFKFNSNEEKIILAWMNNKFTLRKRGDKKDVYNVFLSMLKTGEIPSDWDLLSQNAASSTTTNKPTS